MIANWFFLQFFFATTYVGFEIFDWSTFNEMDNYSSLTPRILTPFNYIYWREDMQITLHNKGMYRMKMGREVKPQ